MAGQNDRTAAKYCFVVLDEDDACIGIAVKAEWKRSPGLDENFVPDAAFRAVFPAGFHSVGEAVWEYRGTMKEARDKLVAAGFEEVEKPKGW